jgi:hypothetical protein
MDAAAPVHRYRGAWRAETAATQRCIIVFRHDKTKPRVWLR